MWPKARAVPGCSRRGRPSGSAGLRGESRGRWRRRGPRPAISEAVAVVTLARIERPCRGGRPSDLEPAASVSTIDGPLGWNRKMKEFIPQPGMTRTGRARCSRAGEPSTAAKRVSPSLHPAPLSTRCFSTFTRSTPRASGNALGKFREVGGPKSSRRVQIRRGAASSRVMRNPRGRRADEHDAATNVPLCEDLDACMMQDRRPARNWPGSLGAGRWIADPCPHLAAFFAASERQKSSLRHERVPFRCSPARQKLSCAVACAAIATSTLVAIRAAAAVSAKAARVENRLREAIGASGEVRRATSSPMRRSSSHWSRKHAGLLALRIHHERLPCSVTRTFSRRGTNRAWMVAPSPFCRATR